MTKTRVDIDSIETKEWLDALSSVVRYEGKERAGMILDSLLQHACKLGLQGTFASPLTTSYTNTISPKEQPVYPGDLALEANIEAYLRWNAIAMVMKAKKHAGGVGGHLSSYASIATLYEVGLNHCFRGDTEKAPGDLVFFQGHSAEGNYARAYLEDRLSAENLDRFRQEVAGKGLSSYPHPWLMPHFWQFATVSLGIGMLQGIYQARFLKYLENRGIQATNERRVWVFCGDGEMDEVDATGGLTLASRENLNNLVFVINCNLQRLDGLVRSNSKVVQEFEGLFRGAGWQVLKVLWNSAWDPLFAKDKTGALARRLQSIVDGDLQTATVRGAEYFRDFIFNTDELKALIADWSNEKLLSLGRGAHDPVKVYAAYAKAMASTDRPTVILAQGIKGYGLGFSGAEGRNIAHNHLELTEAELKAFRDRFTVPISDDALLNLDYLKPADDSEELRYLKKRRAELGGFLPARHVQSQSLAVPALDAFSGVLQGSADRTMSTTMVLGRIINVLLKDKILGQRVVPIFSDEVRTFGLEALFRQVGIYSSHGQLYTPEDKEQFLYYHETKNGQVLEEGITEAGCMASWTAAATAYATHRQPMVPFFTYYSMFGFQRVGDYIWAAADMRARGFLIGATAGRTTLEGEGLQHQDGSSLLTASTVPTCRAYDPAFGYEMAVIIQHGLHAMFTEERDEFYYVTAMNERYIQPSMPEKVEAGIIKGLYRYQAAEKTKHHVQLLGSGAILNEVIEAAALLKAFGVAADVWSVTSFGELRREAADIERYNRLHPTAKPKQSYVASCLEKAAAPIIAATDYVHAYADLIRPYLNEMYITLGTDGFGRSDTRAALRRFFEVDRHSIVITALWALVKKGELDATIVTDAMQQFGLDPKQPNPVTV